MKRSLTAFLVILTGLLFAAGCAKRQTVQTPGQSQLGTNAGQQNTNLAKESVASNNLPAGQETGGQPNTIDMNVKIEDVHFDFDKYDIRSDAKPVLKNVSDLLAKNEKSKVAIEGNCDARGTEEYNLALGDRRANAAKTYLESLGIPSARIQTVSYGKDKPLCKDSTEACYAKNRRDHFVLNEPK